MVTTIFVRRSIPIDDIGHLLTGPEVELNSGLIQTCSKSAGMLRRRFGARGLSETVE